MPSIGYPVGATIVAAGTSSSTQGPSAVDVAHQITFGSGGTISGDITINANGSATCNVSGTFLVILELNYGRANSTGTAQVVTRVLINGTQLGDSADLWLPGSSSRDSRTSTFVLALEASDIVTFEMVRDGAGTNDGSLYAHVTTTPGWEDVPSAGVSFFKFSLL